MTYTPYISSSGIAGWNFLQTTYDRQYEAFTQTGTLASDAEYFMENIGDVQTSEDLLGDRRLLEVAVTAFGLDEEIDYYALLQRVLNEGTSASDALANTMDDERYVNFSEAFGFGSGQTLKTADNSAMQSIVDSYQTAEFETAVGFQDETMQTALFAQRAFGDILGEDVDESSGNRDIVSDAVSDFLEKIADLDDDSDSETQSVEERWADILDRDVLVTFFDTTFETGQDVLVMSNDEKIEYYMNAAEAEYGSADPTTFFSTNTKDSVLSAYNIRAITSGVDDDERAEVLELSGLLLGAMVADEAELNDVWADLLENTQIREFFEVTFNLSDTETLSESTALELFRTKGESIFGSEDPRDFMSEDTIEDTLLYYSEAAAEQGISSADISLTTSVVESLADFLIEEAVDDVGNTYEVDAKWYAIMGETQLPGFFQTTYDLDDDFDSLPRAEQLATYKEKTLEYYGTEDPEEAYYSYNSKGLLDRFEENSAADGDFPYVTNYYSEAAERELDKLFPEEESEDIADIIAGILGDDEDEDESDINAMWYTIMGQEALTSFIQTAFGLPSDVGSLDVDQALEIYKAKAKEVMGTEDPSVFANSDNLETLTNRYLALSQIASGSGSLSSGSIAMTLLSS